MENRENSLENILLFGACNFPNNRKMLSLFVVGMAKSLMMMLADK
jgi:hypothetical protein